MKIKFQVFLKIFLVFFLLCTLSYHSCLAVVNNDLSILTTEKTPKSYHHRLTLITGDVLYLTKEEDKQWHAVIKPAKRPYGKATFTFYTDQNDHYFIVPVDVIPLLDHTLDPTFFNITYLIENEMDDEHMPFISTIALSVDQKKAMRNTQDSGFSPKPLSIIDGFTLSVSKDQMGERSSQLLQFSAQKATISFRGVKRLILDRKVYATLDKSVPLVGGDIAHNELGFDGTGVNVAVLDTGVDPDHPDFFFEDGSSKIAANTNCTCFTNNNPFICDETPMDLNSHGTHVSGIALGVGDTLKGQYKGIAPGATLLNIKVLNRYGFGMVSNILHGFERALFGTNEIRGDEPIIEADVISMSIGGPAYGDDPLVFAVNKAVTEYNVPVVISAGNSGPRSFSIGSPGVAENAITVGASTKFSPITMARFSSRGPAPLSYLSKPDIVAPGYQITAACSSKPAKPNCLPEHPYVNFSGTSMSAPLVSGAVALMIQQRKEQNQPISAHEIKDSLLNTAHLLFDTETQPETPMNGYTQGAGFMKIGKALTAKAMLSPSTISFGKIPVNSLSLSKTITLKNNGKEQKKYQLSAVLSDVATLSHSSSGGNAFDHAITVTPEQLTLNPNERVTATVDIDVSKLPIPFSIQAYSGFIYAEDSTGEKIHGVIGFTREGNLCDLTIKGINRNGKPAKKASVDIFNPESSNGYRISTYLNERGEATLRLPSDLYNINMMVTDRITDPNGITQYVYSRLSELEVNVGDAPVSVLLDARNAKPVSLKMPADPDATMTAQQVAMYAFMSPDGGLWYRGLATFGGEFDGFCVYSNKAPTIGTMEVFTLWQKTREPAFESTVFYNLVDVRQNDEPYTLTITKADLATYGVNVTSFHTEKEQLGFYSNAPSCYGEKISLRFPIAASTPLKTPMTRYEYITPNKLGSYAMVSPHYNDPFTFMSSDRTDIKGKLYKGKRFNPGEKRFENWFQRPFNPALTKVIREKEFLTMRGSAFMDPMGRLGKFDIQNVEFEMTVRAEGKLKGYKSNFSSPLTVFLPPESQQIELKLSSKDNPLASEPRLEAKRTITFTTDASSEGPLAIPNTRYQADALTKENKIPSDGGLEFDVIFTSSDSTLVMLDECSLMLSVDEGKNWFQPSSVEIDGDHLEVESAIPMNSKGYTSVSVKLNALTSQGVTLEEEIKHAFIMVLK